jgi:peptidylprolyl isomerase
MAARPAEGYTAGMRFLILFTTLAAAPALAQSPPAQTPPTAQPAAAEATAGEWRPLDPQNTLVMETTKGRMIIEMRPDLAPLAVARIKTLSKRGYYDGALFYRVIADYMAQGGDKGERTFKSDLPNLRAEFTFRRQSDTPFALVGNVPNGEVGFVGALPVRFDKFSDGSQQGYAWFCPGVAAMPHYDDPNSANSQMFFLRRHATNLEKEYTAWGRVVQGQAAVDAFANGEPPAKPDKMMRVRLLADLPEPERPRLEVMDTRSPAFSELARKTMAEKGRAFSLCDLQIPVREAPAS